jgi:hypothetical protein
MGMTWLKCNIEGFIDSKRDQEKYHGGRFLASWDWYHTDDLIDKGIEVDCFLSFGYCQVNV